MKKATGNGLTFTVRVSDPFSNRTAHWVNVLLLFIFANSFVPLLQKDPEVQAFLPTILMGTVRYLHYFKLTFLDICTKLAKTNSSVWHKELGSKNPEKENTQKIHKEPLRRCSVFSERCYDCSRNMEKGRTSTASYVSLKWNSQANNQVSTFFRVCFIGFSLCTESTILLQDELGLKCYQAFIKGYGKWCCLYFLG